MLLILILPLSLGAQKIFQQPKTIQQVVGRMNFEQKAWAYRYSPQYVKNVTFTAPVISYSFPVDKITKQYSNDNFIRATYTQQLSFFCRQEYKFEKYTKIPLRFRLGSLDYTNYLEQKPNAIKPGF
ncbi:MAG: hypothetical protein ACHQEB_00910 [Chitinophagales bacterium]